jgi:hypothetical protein
MKREGVTPFKVDLNDDVFKMVEEMRKGSGETKKAFITRLIKNAYNNRGNIDTEELVSAIEKLSQQHNEYSTLLQKNIFQNSGLCFFIYSEILETLIPLYNMVINNLDIGQSEIDSRTNHAKKYIKNMTKFILPKYKKCADSELQSIMDYIFEK